MLCGNFNEHKNHTYGRNTGNIGVAIECMLDGSITREGLINYGTYPPTDAQLDALAQVAACLCIELGFPLANVKTHSEWAEIDGYGLLSGDPDMRWDLYGMGSILRMKAREYGQLWGSQI